MLKNNLLLIFLIILTINWNSCNGHAIKLQPAASYSASYSGSSASSSAFSHSSSSSFSVNGNLDLINNSDGVLDALKTGAGAVASASAVAGADAASGANLAEAGAVSAAHSASGSVAGHSLAAANSGSVTGNFAANSNAGAYSSATQNSNAEKSGSSSSSSEIDETYKTIGSNKYTTSYSGEAKVNQDTAGCTTCVKKPFPGPNGSIHDYKIVSSVAPSVVVPVPVPTVSVEAHPTPIIVNPNPHNYRPAAQSTYVVNLIPTFPGPSGSIHSSKPVTNNNNNNNGAATFSSAQSGSVAQNVYQHAGPTVVNQNHGISSAGSLSGIISQLPGPSGSIYDSKPASIGAGTVAHSSAVAESASNSYGGNFAVVPTTVSVTPVIMPIYTTSSATQKFPGPSGSIYSSYPTAVNNGPSNIPLTHPIVGPVCSYSPGSPNNCENNKSSSSSSSGTIQENFAATVSANEAYSGAGSITNNPIISTSSPSGTSCRYSSQDGKCGSVINEANTAANSHAAASASASAVTDAASYKGPFPGPSGSIYDSKPVSTLSTITNTGSASSSSTSETNDHTSGAVLVPTPTTLLIKEDFNTPNNIVAPSIHPEVPSGGTYYVNKPALEVQAPELSFVAQIPCADSSCSSAIKKTTELSTSADSISASNSYSSSGSNFVYKNNDKNNNDYSYSSNLGHDDNANNNHHHHQQDSSGRIIYKNDDGSYYNGERNHQNAAHHAGYAVSSNDADNKGILVSPGTGFLPVEDHQKSNFGHQIKTVAGASSSSIKGDENSKSGTSAGSSYAASSAHASSNNVNSAESLNEAVKISPIKCFTCNGAGDGKNREVVVVEDKPSSSYVGQDFGTNYVNNGAYFNYPETGVLLNKLFGGNNKAEGFSGAVSKTTSNNNDNNNNNGQSGSAAYSSAGSFASSGGASFASASSHAGSYGR